MQGPEGDGLVKMARVILFTGQIDAMSKFYGEVLGLSQVSNEKGWREFDAGGSRIALHSGPSSPGRKVQRLFFTHPTLPPCAKRWWRAAPASVRSDKGMCFAYAMVKIPTAIPFSCPIDEFIDLCLE